VPAAHAPVGRGRETLFAQFRADALDVAEQNGGREHGRDQDRFTAGVLIKLPNNQVLPRPLLLGIGIDHTLLNG